MSEINELKQKLQTIKINDKLKTGLKKKFGKSPLRKKTIKEEREQPPAALSDEEKQENQRLMEKLR